MAVKLVNVSKKLYVGIVRDHSGSMDWLSKAAMEDYNSLITTIRNASDQQDVDTIVSTVKCGVGVSGSNEREVINSSVLRLKPLTTYRADGSYTPLFDAVADVIDWLEKVPDAKTIVLSSGMVVCSEIALHACKMAVIGRSPFVSRSRRNRDLLSTTFQQAISWNGMSPTAMILNALLESLKLRCQTTLVGSHVAFVPQTVFTRMQQTSAHPRFVAA